MIGVIPAAATNVSMLSLSLSLSLSLLHIIYLNPPPPHTHTDIFGALMCSMFIGLAFAAFTCLLMYYDSDDPGHFPPTPVSPRRDGE